MSNTLKPSDYGLNNLELNPCRIDMCRECGDDVRWYRWSPYFCPDCDIKRMARISAGMKVLADAFPESVKPGDGKSEGSEDRGT